MSNRTYVCLECHTAKRAEAKYSLLHNFRCALCSKPLIELPWRRRVPAKDDTAGWKTLAILLHDLESKWATRLTKNGQTKLAKIDRHQRRKVQKDYSKLAGG